MLAIVMVILGLAALYGFLLMVYYFMTKGNLSTPKRWIGSLVGGAFASAIMVFLAFLIIWPPVNILLTVACLGVISLISGVVLLNVNMARIDELAELNRREINDELDDCSSNVDVSSRA